jgi:hypothetical protein
MTNRDVAGEPGAEAGIADLERDLERTREQLGDTIDAISAKLDVKTQMKDTASRARANVVDSTSHAKEVVVDKVGEVADSDAVNHLRARPWPVLALAAGFVVAGVIVWKRVR